MRSRKLRNRALWGAVVAFGGGMAFSNGCLNSLLSVPVCGVVLPTTVCTPQDQLLLSFKYLEVPDFSTDPSCTIPFECSGPGNSLYPFGGGPPVAPTQGNQGGGGGTGGGGGGGAGI